MTINKLAISIFMIGLLSCSRNIILHNTEPINSFNRDINPEGIEKDILYYINQHRKSMGLNSLSMLKEASTEAIQHSVDMAKRKTGFGHEGFEKRVKHIAEKTGAYAAAAENVAYGKLNAQQVVEGWLNSPGHRKNIEGDFTFTGVGTATDRDGVTYFTQIFIRQQ